MTSLVWKEWHEQRWKLAFGCLILAALAVIGLRTRVVADETLLSWTCALGVCLLPVLASMGLVPAERGEGTFVALLALPIQPRRIFIAKMVAGILLCAGPIIVAAALSLAMAGGREMSGGQIVELYSRSLAASLSLFFWMFALTIRLPTEARAGMVALGLLICWMLITAGLYATAEPNLYGPNPLWLVTPFFFTFGFTESWIQRASLGLAAQVLIAIALFAFAASQMTREEQA